ncbi:MAG: glycosyltransferase family 2 protein [Vicinamibacterales bacterium]
MTRSTASLTYVLPIRSAAPDDDLKDYLLWLTARARTIVVDGSAPAVFAAHRSAWAAAIDAGLQHVPPAPDLATEMGKVGGVLTGLRLADGTRMIIADEDVRYDEAALAAVLASLDSADVVRPQNYFAPLPWHACWDTGRILLNRVSGGDWPGTLGVRTAVLRATGGYDGRAMFENLELVRTVIAAGGRESVRADIFVRRLPSSTGHFWSQRVRQAYDEFARPWRLGAQLALLPAASIFAARGRWQALMAGVAVVVMVAECGRWRDGGRRVFPARASLFAPVWLAERAVCVWLAIGARLLFGGVRYRGRVLRHAATPLRVLRARHAGVRLPASGES